MVRLHPYAKLHIQLMQNKHDLILSQWQAIVIGEMNAAFLYHSVMCLAIQSVDWQPIGLVIALTIALGCYIRWIVSRRGTWMVGVGVAIACLVFSQARIATFLLPIIWIHAVCAAFHYARNVNSPCPHHTRLPRFWRRFACSNLRRCRNCNLIYPLALLGIALITTLLLLHEVITFTIAS
jgi:hypothetical protein